MRRWLVHAVLLIVAVSVTACGTTSTTTWYGTVTTLQPRLCVGRPAAMGDCFTGETPSMLAWLRVGQCVRVTFDRNTGRLRDLRQASFGDHTMECPTG